MKENMLDRVDVTVRKDRALVGTDTVQKHRCSDTEPAQNEKHLYTGVTQIHEVSDKLEDRVGKIDASPMEYAVM